MKKTLLSTAVALALGVVALQAQASTVNTGDTLSITQGVPVIVGSGSTAVQTNVTGSWFAMDQTTSLNITGPEKVAINPGTQGGIVIGVTQSHGPVSASGQLTGPGQIDSWSFFGANGGDWTTTGLSGSTTGGLNMAGWTVRWNGSDIPMTTGAWQPANCSAFGCSGYTFQNGVAQFVWDGVYGDSYTLNYAATVTNAPGNAASFDGVKYLLHLTGTVGKAPAVVPLPAAVWLFGSGLLGLVGITRRKRSGQG